MELRSQKCEICHRDCNVFNYGAQCCNACKMFFRRVISFKTILKSCELNEECFDRQNENIECRLCRFQKCISAGMIQNQERLQLPSVLLSLSQLEFHKRNILERCQPLREYTYEEVTDVAPVLLVSKSSNIEFTSFDWEAMTQIATVDYLKKINFSRILTSSDLKAFLKGTHLNCALFSTAMHYYLLNSGIIMFPDGKDVCPSEMRLVTSLNSSFEIGIKSRLIGRLAELRVTKEEFLLTNMIFICNPVVPNLSKTGSLLLSTYQQIYSNLLFQHCQMINPRNAPSRFTDLLSLAHIVAKTKKDISMVVLLLHLHQPNMEWKEICRSAIDYLLKN